MKHDDRFDAARESLDNARATAREARRVARGATVAVGFTGRLIVGLAVIAAGILFTLDNLDLVDSWTYLRFWPAILIVIGVLNYLQGRGRVGSVIFIAIGTWLLLNTLDIVDLDLGDLFPLVLVAIGVHLVWRSVRPRQPERSNVMSTTDADSKVSAFAMMAGIERKNTSNEFRGGDLTAIMGGCELDLRQAKLATDGDVVVDVFAVWGGVNVRIPQNWSVVGQVTPLMGAYEDKTSPPQSPEARLIVRGMAIMGGIEVTN